MDYNWLYSAIAQSCAAIVGIFGALLFTKVINQQSAFRARRDKCSRYALDIQHLVDRAENCSFAWYNLRRTESVLASLRYELESEKNIQSPEVYYSRHNFSPFQSQREVLDKIENVIRSEVQRRQTPKSLGFNPGLLSSLDLDKSTAEAVVAERDKIDLLAIDIRQTGRALSEFLFESRRQPEVSPLVTYSSIATLLIFFTGVVWPLSFMPVPQGEDIRLSVAAVPSFVASVKGLVLITVSIVFVSVVLLFVAINLRLKIDAAQLDELEEFVSEGAYSDYFAVRLENESC